MRIRILNNWEEISLMTDRTQERYQPFQTCRSVYLLVAYVFLLIVYTPVWVKYPDKRFWCWRMEFWPANFPDYFGLVFGDHFFLLKVLLYFLSSRPLYCPKNNRRLLKQSLWYRLISEILLTCQLFRRRLFWSGKCLTCCHLQFIVIKLMRIMLFLVTTLKLGCLLILSCL